MNHHRNLIRKDNRRQRIQKQSVWMWQINKRNAHTGKTRVIKTLWIRCRKWVILLFVTQQLLLDPAGEETTVNPADFITFNNKEKPLFYVTTTSSLTSFSFGICHRSRCSVKRLCDSRKTSTSFTLTKTTSWGIPAVRNPSPVISLCRLNLCPVQCDS